MTLELGVRKDPSEAKVDNKVNNKESNFRLLPFTCDELSHPHPTINPKL